MKLRTGVKAVIGILSLVLLALNVYADSVSAPQRTQGLLAPPAQGENQLVRLRGPGKFISAEISKQGGATDLTFVNLDIDGKNVVSVSMAALRNWGLTSANPYGLVLLQSPAGIKTVTIGFNSSLEFKSELVLKVTVSEPNVVQIVANVIHGH
jgi:hypothetical protein